VQDQTETFTFGATDPDSTQTAAGFTYKINWGDGSAVQTVSPTANNGSGVQLTHQFTTVGNYTVSVTATNQVGLVSTTATQGITISSGAPTASVNGPTAGVRNQTEVFTFGATDPDSTQTAAGFTYTINWGDGSAVQTVQPTANNGSGVQLTHQYTSNGNFTVSVTATNNAGLVSNTATQSIIISTGAPTAMLLGPPSGVRYQPESFTFSATDPDSTQTAAGFTYTINWGDGSAVQTVQPTANNGSGVTLIHQFITAGTYTVSVTATNQVGLVSTVTTQNITIAAAAVLSDPLHPGQNALYIGGTAASDTIRVRQVSTGSYAMVVKTGLNAFGNILVGPVSRIVVYTGDGNDTVRFNANVTVPTWTYAGAGNDNLQGAANAPNVIVGGTGNSLLRAGARRDILIGGSGSERLVGSTASDLLIAGTTLFDHNETALNALQLEWTAHLSYAARVAGLRGTGKGPNNNGKFFLVASGPNETVFGSDKGSSLTSGTGQDWFFAKVSGTGLHDTLPLRTPSETVDRLA
jgi:PKD repeat protein